MEKVYATALTQAVSRGENEKKLAEGLIAHLTKVGRMKLLSNILRELKAREERTKKLRPTLEIANEGEKVEAQKQAEALGLTPEAIEVNPSLISGFRVRSATQLVDRSGKQSLIDIYKNIVTK